MQSYLTNDIFNNDISNNDISNNDISNNDSQGFSTPISIIKIVM